MKKSIKRAALAFAMLPVLANAPAFASGASFAEPAKPESTLLNKFADGLLPNWGSRAKAQAPQQDMQLAQAADPRVGQLQEQLREMSGKIEELNFQIMQLQEQLRKTQEDNEFRFQELEKNKRSDAGDKSDRTVASAQHAPAKEASQDASSSAVSDHAPAHSASNPSVGADSMATGQNVEHNNGTTGAPPQSLGSIRFDSSGNVIGETLSAAPQPVHKDNTGLAAPAQAGGDVVASLPQDDNPNSLYQASYQYLMSGDYKAAETGFNEHVKRYPADPQTAEARYWLGESLYAQGRYAQAATVFLDTQRDYPESKRGAENMLKLGLSLEKMDNRDVACATFTQIPQRYPKAAPSILKRVTDERSRIKC